MSTIVAASLLSADFFDLKTEFKRMNDSGVDMLHYDVMDGVFVNNISFGIPVLSSIKKHTEIFLDAHLMIVNPEKYIKNFADAGADMITFHYEATDTEKILDIINLIHSFNIKAGISVKPSTEIKVLFPYLNLADNFLVMSVEPGFGGQGFITETVDKIKDLRKMLDSVGSEAMLQVDGGINDITSTLVKNAGADNLVSGSFLFKSENMKNAVDLLKN